LDFLNSQLFLIHKELITGVGNCWNFARDGIFILVGSLQ